VSIPNKLVDLTIMGTELGKQALALALPVLESMAAVAQTTHPTEYALAQAQVPHTARVCKAAEAFPFTKLFISIGNPTQVHIDKHNRYINCQGSIVVDFPV
jgi:hypothetical protein